MTLTDLIAAIAADPSIQAITFFRDGRAHIVTRAGAFPFSTLEALERGLSQQPATPITPSSTNEPTTKTP